MLDLNLKNKKVLITGASKGMGFAIAQTFAEQGAYINGVNLLVDGGLTKGH